jgi:hypothetical protein
MPARRKPFDVLEASGAVAHDPQRFRERQPESKSEELSATLTTSLNGDEKKVRPEIGT